MANAARLQSRELDLGNQILREINRLSYLRQPAAHKAGWRDLHVAAACLGLREHQAGFTHLMSGFKLRCAVARGWLILHRRRQRCKNNLSKLHILSDFARNIGVSL